MPQMSPYNWLILFLMFNIIFITFMSMNNFIKLTMIKSKNIHSKNLYFWKW